ncbi:MAG: phytoene desaturase [Planctomycetota bacterium]|nr:MAG: phytoene desaturase [Planctomycetota bacterium]
MSSWIRSGQTKTEWGSHPMSKNVIVIGAGPGGLASAMLLAHAGLNVRVLERLPEVGGRTRTLRSESGFHFDLGPTFFLYPTVLRSIFEHTGLDLDERLDLVRLDPQYRVVFGKGGELLATPDVERMEQAIAALAPLDATRFQDFLADNREKLERFRPCLETPFLGWRDVLSRRLLSLLPLVRPWRSLEQEVGQYFSDERIRLAFTFQSKYLGMSPFRCPSLFSILSFLEYEHGVYHPIGGCGAVTRAMADAATELGAKISTGEEVRGLEFRRKRVVGVHTDRGSYPCDAIVINADFARAMKRFVPDRLRRRWSDRKIAKSRFSCSTFMLYLGIEGRFDDVSHHTIYIPERYRRNLEDIERNGVVSEELSFYVQNASVTDPTLAPDGMSTLYVLVPVPNRRFPIDWSTEAPRLRGKVFRHLKKIGLGDVERRVRYERMITPEDWDRRHEIHLGATFSLAHNLRQMLHLRPRNRFADLDGVYLTGGGTHPGSGLPVIFESARITSKLLVEDFGGQMQPGGRPSRRVSEAPVSGLVAAS